MQRTYYMILVLFEVKTALLQLLLYWVVIG